MGEKSFLPKKLPLIGSKAKKLKDNLYYGNGVSKVFFDCVMKTCVDYGLYLQKKITTKTWHFKSLLYHWSCDGNLE